jgi:hypothetical protein
MKVVRMILFAVAHYGDKYVIEEMGKWAVT